MSIKRTNKAENTVFIIFLILGLALLIFGTAKCILTFDHSDTVDITGVVTRMEPYEDFDGETSYTVYVSYQVDGKEYEEALPFYSSLFKEGKEIRMYYHKDDPTNIGVRSIELVFLILPGFGMILFLIGLIPLLVRRAKAKNALLLRDMGVRREAQYIETRPNKHYTVNHSHPYRIFCQWTDPYSHETLTFKSENLWSDPAQLIAARGITSFSVYVDPSDPKKYTVDTTVLDFE